MFATLWAAVNWPWFAYAEHPANNHAVSWILCVFFLVLTAGLAAGKRWARGLGLAAAVALLALLVLVLGAAYFISLFGDQALGFDDAARFLGGIALSIALIRLLARPLALTDQPAERDDPVWIPVAFSAAYLVGGWIVSRYTGSGTWGGFARAININVAMFSMALPSILLLWLVWAWWSRGTIIRSLPALVLASFMIPFAVSTVAFAVFAANTAVDERQAGRTEHQLGNAHMSELADEVLLSQHGNPIGIRLRYRVRFDEGLDDIRYRPSVSLNFESPSLAMSKVRSETDPIFEGGFRKGEYRFTEDFVPSYFPGFMQFPTAPQRADDRCFYWGFPGARETATDSEARHATIYVVFPSSLRDHATRRSSSSFAYSQSYFYNSALNEGARDCR